ncbi:calcium-independent protein kinase C [Plectosphaerella plurivora]|uniref:Protein kinase C-like n=1 Tax=Plectosphaerella plurivora TaxID=936078 RepID=A0A9P8V4M9_9PEZI|nr:calcium-independent protein kinase C [Plectosphaerella plurivora]
MADEDAVANIYKKIEREKALLNAANAMLAQTDNDSVRSRLNSQIRDGRRNVQFFEEKLRELQMRRVNSGMDNMSLRSGDAGDDDGSGPPPPPPKDSSSWEHTRSGSSASASYGSAQYGKPGPQGGDLVPPKHPYAPPGPGSSAPKTRPNFTKLDLIKYDTPYLGPRIQLMLSQIQFKLKVEEQYLKGVEKMVQLYSMEGDRKSKADAAARRVESKQKMLLLKQALKRYEELHVADVIDIDGQDDDSINMPNLRKPLTGQLSIRVGYIKDVDHAATGRFSRGPETFVAIKVEDNIVARTRLSRTDKWEAEHFNIDVDKANEIELTVYDKPGEHAMPIAMLWVRISDIAEEMRRKRIEAEINSSGWVSADRMGSAPSQFPMSPQQQSFGAPPMSPGAYGGQPGAAGGASHPLPPQPPQQGQAAVQPIDGLFNLEPAGQIRLTLGFVKQNKERRAVDVGLGRKGAIRQRKEEVHEMYGHKFVQHQFYNIMRCALCGDFLKYSAGMQCEDCKYTCHTKCYTSVVTKCISKSNAETDPDEEKINHRIPHRFQPYSNMTANWCCHCGYILPFGKKNCRKCAECGLTAHAQCVHLVPDFCGMSMAVANQILEGIRTTKQINKQKATSMSERTLRNQGRTSPTSSMSSTTVVGGSSHAPSYSTGSAEATEAAKLMYQHQTSSRPAHPDRTSSSSAAAAAASAAMSGYGAASGRPQTQSQDYGRYSGGYGAPPAEQAPEDRSDYGQYGGQQRKYNPADYASVDAYSAQHQMANQRQQQMPQQHAPPRGEQPPQLAQQPMYSPAAGPPVPKPEPSPVTPVSVTSTNTQRKPLPSATDPGTGARIGLDHFNFLAVLGKGNFGKVMLAETKKTKKLYAIKVLKKEFIMENDEVESIRSEKRVFLIANRERHPFLTNLHACFQTETRVYFVEEYISGGDLMLHIQRGQFGTKRAQFYAAEVCLALKYFHENGVIYRDLKLDNILLTLDGHIKIADYGLCKEDMWYGSTTSTFCGTPEFMAPEILLDKKYGRAVDWWAFGVLIYQMLLQQSPFRGEDEDEIYDAILADEPLYPIHMPRDSVSILQKLLTRDPDQRLGSGPTDAQEIMSQPFFRNVVWDDIYNKRVAPPFLPQIKSATDTSNFDSEFTSVTPVLTPVQSVLSQAMQEEFRGFSYTADFD